MLLPFSNTRDRTRHTLQRGWEFHAQVSVQLQRGVDARSAPRERRKARNSAARNATHRANISLSPLGRATQHTQAGGAMTTKRPLLKRPLVRSPRRLIANKPFRLDACPPGSTLVFLWGRSLSLTVLRLTFRSSSQPVKLSLSALSWAGRTIIA